MKKFSLKSSDKLERKLILSALLSSLTFIFYFFSNVPILNLAGVILCPLPLTLVSYVYGIGFGITSMLVSLFLTFIFLGPLQAYFFLSIFGFLGVIIGWFTRILLDPVKVAFWTLIVILVLNLFFYYGIERVLGLEDILKEMKGIFLKLGNFLFSYLLPVKWKIYFLKYVNVLLEIPLFIFFLLSFSMFYINFAAAGFIFNRFSIPFPTLPPIVFWRLPLEALITFILTLAFLPFLREYKVFFYLGINLVTIFYFSFLVVGYGLTIYLMAFYNLGPLMRLFLLLTIIFLNFLLVILGMLDSVLDLRSRLK